MSLPTIPSAQVLSSEEIQLVTLIDQIVFDTLESLASTNFANSPDGKIVVTREMLAAIMAPAALTAYEAARSGVYVTANRSVPKHLLN